MLPSAFNKNDDSSCGMRMGGLWLLLLLCAPCCCSGAPNPGGHAAVAKMHTANRTQACNISLKLYLKTREFWLHSSWAGLPKRTLLQQQQQPQELLSALSDAPDNDPFASAHIGKPFLSRFAALVPKSLQHQLQLLQHSLSRVAEEHGGSSGGHAHTAIAHHRRHHHRVVRHNTTHTWVHSPVLELELPQPWDDINLTTIVRSEQQQLLQPAIILLLACKTTRHYPPVKGAHPKQGVLLTGARSGTTPRHAPTLLWCRTTCILTLCKPALPLGMQTSKRCIMPARRLA